MTTVLSIGAHPDDIEIGCGGAEILLKRKGSHIIHLIATSGEEGGLDINKGDLIYQRELETQNAAKIIGADEVIFLRYPDNLTGYDKEMKLHLISLIRRYKPDIIFTHASCDSFPDHQIIHHLTLSAATIAAGPWCPDLKSRPHSVSYIYGYEVWHPIQNVQSTISIESVINLKLQALACHKSQINNVDYMSAVRGLAAYRGVMTMKSAYAEVFEVIRSECLSFLSDI